MCASHTHDLRTAVRTVAPVSGFNHDLYRYPARFPPIFARSAIAAFTQPSDTVYDPFVGGGTTLVEARIAGRHAVGTDISELAIYVAKTKSSVLKKQSIESMRQAKEAFLDALVLRNSDRLTGEPYYQRHLNNKEVWRLQRTIERAIFHIDTISCTKQRRFMRCVLLRTSQWAIDCRKTPPSVSRFRQQLSKWFDEALKGAHEFRRHATTSQAACWRLDALDISNSDRLRRRGPFKLILTSPPYVSTHVLYHRWQVLGRKETPAPFWITGTKDGQGGSYYTLGDYRYHNSSQTYFKKIENIFSQIHPLIDPQGVVVQMVGFTSDAERHKYNSAMRAAGFRSLESFRRPLPGTRRFYTDLGHVARKDEYVLIHRPVPQTKK